MPSPTSSEGTTSPPGQGRSAAGPGPDRGQATVELALVLPVVLILILALVQVGLVIADQARVTDAARDGARAAAVDARPGAARRAVDRAGLDPARTEVARRTDGARVTVTVAYSAPTRVPLVGNLTSDVGLREAVTMLQEDPGD